MSTDVATKQAVLVPHRIKLWKVTSSSGMPKQLWFLWNWQSLDWTERSLGLVYQKGLPGHTKGNSVWRVLCWTHGLVGWTERRYLDDLVKQSRKERA